MASSKAAKPVVLHQDKREKAMYEDFGDLFAIIKTTEKLERDLLQSMHRVAELKPDFAGKIKMKEWIGKLHAMPASQELQEDEVRQLLFDLEFGYNAFMASLGPQTSFGNSP
eukprot:jgi/Pico_ML_1/50566/g1753.t1